MKYMLLIYVDPSQSPAPGTDEAQANSQAWMDISTELGKAGVLVDGAGLQTPDTATTISVPNGDRVVTDGPFAETKEFLGGYYTIDVPDLDGALDWAAKLPNQQYGGSVEVRPVLVF